jgi:hypothetical protein
LESPRGSGRSPCLADLPFLRDQTLKVSQYTVHESIPEGDTMADTKRLRQVTLPGRLAVFKGSDIEGESVHCS